MLNYEVVGALKWIFQLQEITFFVLLAIANDNV